MEIEVALSAVKTIKERLLLPFAEAEEALSRAYDAETQIKSLNSEIERKKKELEEIGKELREAKESRAAQAAKIKQDYDNLIQRTRESSDAEIAKIKLALAEERTALAAFRKEAETEKKALEDEKERNTHELEQSYSAALLEHRAGMELLKEEREQLSAAIQKQKAEIIALKKGVAELRV